MTRFPPKMPPGMDWALLVGSILAGLVLCEVAYRAYVTAKVYIQQREADRRPSFGFAYPSPYVFHRELGYQFPAGLRYVWGGIHEGALAGCDVRPFIIARGNMGAIQGNYDNANLKILVVGDSFSATQHGWDGVTWPHQVQLNLEGRLGRSVHVVNVARPGQGLLEMISHAAFYLPVYKPDLALVAYITDDLRRNRHWRKVIQGDRYERMAMSVTPEFDTVSDHTLDVTILNSNVTHSWCIGIQAEVTARAACLERKVPSCPQGRLQDDPVVVELVEQYRFLRDDYCRRADFFPCKPFNMHRPVFLTLDRSVLYDRMVHGNAFHGVKPTRVLQPFDGESFAEDQRFVRELQTIKNTGTPIHLVHLQTAQEMARRQEDVFTGNDESLNDSLENLTGQPVYGLIDYIDVENPFALVIDPDRSDFHPNRAGIQVYADAITRLLINKNLIPPVRPKEGA